MQFSLLAAKWYIRIKKQNKTKQKKWVLETESFLLNLKQWLYTFLQIIFASHLQLLVGHHSSDVIYCDFKKVIRYVLACSRWVSGALIQIKDQGLSLARLWWLTGVLLKAHRVGLAPWLFWKLNCPIWEQCYKMFPTHRHHQSIATLLTTNQDRCEPLAYSRMVVVWWQCFQWQ